MEFREAAETVIAINQFDPRVQSNKISDAIWADALAPYTQETVWEAIKGHYRLNDETPASPAIIRKRASLILEQRRSRERAIQVTREREALGAHATPIQVLELREAFNTVLKSTDAPTGELVQFNRPEHVGWIDEEPAA